MITIYALHDPEIPGVYVGKTELDPEQRRSIHVFKASRGAGISRKDSWIREVLAAGRWPELEVLETDPEQWQAAEVWWIKEIRFFLGDRCLNVHAGGGGRPIGTGHEVRVDDMRGERHGRLLVIEQALSHSHGARWLCTCDCGNETIVYGSNLRTGRTKSCGCLRAGGVGPAGKMIEVGTRFGRLVVQAEEASERSGRWWRCRCDCGREKTVVGTNLRLKRVQTCGRCERPGP